MLSRYKAAQEQSNTVIMTRFVLAGSSNTTAATATVPASASVTAVATAAATTTRWSFHN